MKLTKNLMCVVVRGGLEVWIDEDKIDNLKALIERGGLIGIGKNLINSKDIVGVFEASTMSDYNHRKNGEWKCEKGSWHKKFEECSCPKVNEKGEIFIKGQGWVKQVKVLKA